jgi:hypothetical protein
LIRHFITPLGCGPGSGYGWPQLGHLEEEAKAASTVERLKVQGIAGESQGKRTT